MATNSAADASLSFARARGGERDGIHRLQPLLRRKTFQQHSSPDTALRAFLTLQTCAHRCQLDGGITRLARWPAVFAIPQPLCSPRTYYSPSRLRARARFYAHAVNARIRARPGVNISWTATARRGGRRVGLGRWDGFVWLYLIFYACNAPYTITTYILYPSTWHATFVTFACCCLTPARRCAFTFLPPYRHVTCARAPHRACCLQPCLPSAAAARSRPLRISTLTFSSLL